MIKSFQHETLIILYKKDLYFDNEIQLEQT